MASKVELLFLHWKNHLQCFNSSLCAESSQVPSLLSLSHLNSSFSTYKVLEPSLSPLPFTCSANEKLSFSLRQSSSSVFLLPLTSTTLQPKPSSPHLQSKVCHLDSALHTLSPPPSMHACMWHAQLPSHIWLFGTPQTTACQVPLSMEFSRQEYLSGLPFAIPLSSKHPAKF